MVTRYVSKFKS